jgi:RNA polymerase sigma factor (sigma-70 family)
VTRIAINEALMFIRQRRVSISLSSRDKEDGQAPSVLDPLDDGPTPEQALAENELRAAVVQAISFLRDNLRIVVLHRELQGLTNEETARRLGLTVSAVKARVFQARRYLKRHLERKYKLYATA